MILSSLGYFPKSCWDPDSSSDAEAAERPCSLKEALPEEQPFISKVSRFLCQAPLELLTQCVLVMLTELEMNVSPLFMLTCRKTTLKHKTDMFIFSVSLHPLLPLLCLWFNHWFMSMPGEHILLSQGIFMASGTYLHLPPCLPSSHPFCVTLVELGHMLFI